MKKIAVYKNREIVAYAKVDDKDFNSLVLYRWTLNAYGYPWRSGQEKRRVLMGRQILGLAHGDERECDHKNRDRLDHRRSNLRVVTHHENMQNRNANHNGTSRFRGVYWDKVKRKWKATGMISGKGFNLGSFDREEDAAKAAQAFRLQHYAGAVD